MSTLVAVNPDACPSCAHPLWTQSWEQLPLVRHAGYGAAERTARRICAACGYTMVFEIGAVKP